MTKSWKTLFCFVGVAYFCASCGLSQVLSAHKSEDSPAFDPVATEGSPLEHDDLLFGPELEFTDPVTSKAPLNSRLTYMEELEKECLADTSVVCELESDGPSFEVRDRRGQGRVRGFPSEDPAVLEIPLDPMTLKQAKASRHLIQKFVYDVAAKVGLTPGTAEYNRWSAHTNFSWPGLRDGSDGKLFLRYVADFSSHPEIGMGAFGGDIRNAMVLAMQGTEVQNALAKIVKSFNARPMNVPTLASQISSSVYANGRGYVYGGDRYNALNLSHFSDFAETKKNYEASSPVRIEQRASYMPLSAEHLVSNYTVILGRLAFLARQTSPVHYSPVDLGVELEKRQFATKGVQQGVSAARVAKVYVQYLSEAGLDVKHHVLHMMNPVVQTEAAQRVGIGMRELRATQKRAAATLKVELETYLAPGPFDAAEPVQKTKDSKAIQDP